MYVNGKMRPVETGIWERGIKENNTGSKFNYEYPQYHNNMIIKINKIIF
jgi:hypothetical protein